MMSSFTTTTTERYGGREGGEEMTSFDEAYAQQNRHRFAFDKQQREKWNKLLAARKAAKASSHASPSVETGVAAGHEKVPFFGFGPEGPRFTPNLVR
jgi:hypothetical protein